MIRFQNVTKMYLWFLSSFMVLEILVRAAANQNKVSQNGIPDSLNESQCNSMVIVLLRSASVIGPEMVISELFQLNSCVISAWKISKPLSLKLPEISSSTFKLEENLVTW